MSLDRRTFLATLLAAPAARWEVRAHAQQVADRAYGQLLAEYRRLQESFTREALALAEECEAKGFAPEARDLKARAAPVEEQSLVVDDLPEEMRPAISQNFAPELRSCLVRMRSLEEDFAAALFQLSIKARQKQQLSLTWRLVREAAYHNPDHARARSLLGYVNYENRWMTPFRRQMLKEGKVWHERFGWLPAGDVARYEGGERRFNGRWMAADREASIRSDFNKAWDVRSEHFLVKTNHSLERAVEISVQLERFHEYFVRSFAPVFMSPQQLARLFEGGTNGSPQPPRPHLVHYYRDQTEFVKTLQNKQPEAAFSNGIYLPVPDRTSYFFHRPNAPDEVEETLYHETTHQVLSESVSRPIQVGARANFWLVEGLACYQESFKPEHRGGSVGDPRHVRILWARKFLLEDQVYVPLVQFTAMGQADFQCATLHDKDARFARLKEYYAQAAGVTHFFLHYGEGVYREALVTHLAQIYSPVQRVRDQAPSLDELTGVSFPELDRQYADYLAELP